MKSLPSIILVAIGFVFVITSCIQRTPPGAVLYSAPLPKSKLSNQQRENLTEADIDSLIQIGDEEYANGNFTAAKNYYYEVLLAVPNPSVYVIVSYGSCLAKLGFNENAIEVFNRALEKDPYNETARENIEICKHSIEQKTESVRQFEQEVVAQQQLQGQLAQEQQRQIAETMQNFVGAAAEISAVAEKIQASRTNTDEYDGETGSDSNHSSRSKRATTNNTDCTQVYKQYSYAASSAESIFNRYNDDINGPNAGYAKADYNKKAGELVSIHNKASAKGCTKINRSKHEGAHIR